MKVLFKNIITSILGNKSVEQPVEQPPELTDIVASFETQVTNLDKRIAFDSAAIIENAATIERMKTENDAKNNDIERSNRIKSNIESFIK